MKQSSLRNLYSVVGICYDMRNSDQCRCETPIDEKADGGELRQCTNRYCSRSCLQSFSGAVDQQTTRELDDRKGR